MSRPKARPAFESSSEAAVGALSPAARQIGEGLAFWRARIAETQTLTRLTLSILQGPTPVQDERRNQLGRLLAIEVRSLAQLPRMDFWSLRSTTNVRESGIDLRGPDCTAAERFLLARRDVIVADLTRVAECLQAEDPHLPGAIDGALRDLEDLARVVDLLDVTLYPRLADPRIPIAQAVERAAAPRGQIVTVEGDATAAVLQVRGLIRLLAELVASVGDAAYIHVRAHGAWLELSLSAMNTAAGCDELAQDRVEVLRLAAYLLRIPTLRADGVWQLTLAAQPE
jgi:hypothetical protein